MLVLELLCFCVGRHAYRIKYYILRNHVVEATTKPLLRREPWVGVAVVRFLRTCVGLKVRLDSGSRESGCRVSGLKVHLG